MSSPEVSLVVVAHEARDHVLACLASIAEAVSIDHEVIVVDDGSTDGTADAVSEQFPEVRLIRQPENRGLVAGRNTALKHVKGRFVLMLDSDTLVKEGAVERMARELDEHPSVGLVGPKLVYPDGRVQPSCRRFPPFLLPLLRRGPLARINPEPASHRRHLMYDFDHRSSRPVVWVMGAAQMWRASLPGEIGEFDRRISSYGGEDLDWCLRVWDRGYEVRYLPEAVIVHDWQHVVRRRGLSRAALRALWDWYYLQWKHRRLRRDARLRSANA